MTIQVSEYLATRGLGVGADRMALIRHFHLTDSTYDKRPCIKYPTLAPGQPAAYRVKFIDGNKPKYKWFGGTSQKVYRYYSPGGLVQAIADAGGVLHWCSGEPDVWAMFEAGILNATSCFGEGSVPETVAEDLQAFGVKEVIMYPDLDEPGMQAAGKLARALVGSGVAFTARILPGDMGSKFDLNKLYQQVHSDRAAFLAALEDAPIKTYTDLKDYLPPEPPEPEPLDIRPAATPNTALDIDFGRLFGDWIETVIVALGQPSMRDGTVYRWHCPLPHHEDKHPSFRIGDGKTCKMPICTCGIQDKEPKEAWGEVARAVNATPWDDYKAHHIAEWKLAHPGQSLSGNGTSASQPASAAPEAPINPYTGEPEEEPYFVDSYAALDKLANQLAGLSIPDVEFVEFPFKVLHDYGGFAHIQFPGKLVYIVGISGGGKTSFAETMATSYLKQGLDFVWYGPEWTPDEMAARMLQRAGGAPMIRLASHLMGSIQRKQGVPDNQLTGDVFPDEVAKDNMRKVYDLQSWPGRAYWLTPRANKLPLTAMLDMVGGIIDAKRAAGRKVIGFFFDYLQRANKAGRGDAFWSEAIVSEIKAFCEWKSIIGYVVIQPRKDDSQRVHNGEGQLTEASGQGISDQQCNLYLAIQPVYQDGKPTDAATIKIVKNSMGRTGYETVPTRMEYLLWLDKQAKTVKVDLRSA